MIADFLLNAICYGIGVAVFWVLEIFGLKRRERNTWSYVTAGFLVVIAFLIGVILFVGLT
jgi:hypothetical protein